MCVSVSVKSLSPAHTQKISVTDVTHVVFAYGNNQTFLPHINSGSFPVYFGGPALKTLQLDQSMSLTWRFSDTNEDAITFTATYQGVAWWVWRKGGGRGGKIRVKQK